MFKPYWGKCIGKQPKYKGCGNNGMIMTSSRLLCQLCDDGLKRKKKKDKQASAQEANPGIPANQYALFLAIAKVRPHVCQVTGEPIKLFKSNGQLDVWCFAHCLSKQAFPKFKLYDKNIWLVAPWVHQVYDRGNEQERKAMEKYPGWHKLLAAHDELISEYNNVTR